MYSKQEVHRRKSAAKKAAQRDAGKTEKKSRSNRRVSKGAKAAKG
jgi:hypothetical protein